MAIALVVAAAPAAAQEEADRSGRRVRPELRLDALIARRTAVHGGLGASVPLGTYVRAGAVAGAGALLRGGDPGFSARGELLAHFLLDPFDQFRRSPYVGGGVSVRHDDGRTRGSLVAVAGIEWRARRGYAPAVELGLGTGVRVGLVLRRAGSSAR